MIKVLFVCHGNICRSPMAEYILKDRINKRKLDIYTESRATSFEEIGNDIYPPAKEILDFYHIPYSRHRARRVNQDDYDSFDLIYVMDNNNLRNILRIIDDKDNKIKKLLSCDIEDPWYTGNYEKVYRQIEQGVDEIIKQIRE